MCAAATERRGVHYSISMRERLVPGRAVYHAVAGALPARPGEHRRGADGNRELPELPGELDLYLPDRHRGQWFRGVRGIKHGNTSLSSRGNVDTARS
jgi:hypothetical protein